MPRAGAVHHINLRLMRCNKFGEFREAADLPERDNLQRRRVGCPAFSPTARVVGEKKAREIWYLCRRYTAHEAAAMGLVNKVVPDDQLDAEVEAWRREIMKRSPTAIAIAKRSFNADSDSIASIGALGMQALKLYYETEELKEGGARVRRQA